MKIEIKNKFTGQVVFEHEQEDNSLAITLKVAIKSWADLSGADLSGANLSWADLSRADLSRANLSRANLSWADLSWADLSGADLSRANLSWANLSRADLSWANLSWANLSWANLSWADLSGADLSWAKYGPATVKNGLFQFLGKLWSVFIFDAHIQIGCKLYSTEEWEKFTDDQINQMDIKALEFWKENKELIIGMAKQLQGTKDV